MNTVFTFYRSASFGSVHVYDLEFRNASKMQHFLAVCNMIQPSVQYSLNN